MNEIIEINQEELEKIRQEAGTTLVDIRETLEFQDFNIGGINIPAHLINENTEVLKPFAQLILVCSNGTRSAILTRVFQKKFPDKRIFHLSEGIF
ncbi:rhodanese-like domain-containing protein [Marinilongibacter aquaticus]|uniref:rhodanese-like domain-containing protein n=1 Tax=Marinilongibacter aquaticus TaxID=2975157 RepID=UPI0021BD8823|nr:rhodanese-like domain-containing protein [Marinilongibacter aquaticus]UBM58487.1 rhodanese-like domain-containing protein [Marinilongibacter aquaticus]